MVVTTTKFRMLTNQVANSLNAPHIRVLEVPHPLGGTDEATILLWADAAVDDTLKLLLGGGAIATMSTVTPPEVDLSGADVGAALARVREIVAADGGDIVMESVNAGTARLRLVLDSAECRECVMPRQFLEQIALAKMREVVPELIAVVITDPRES